MCLLAHNEGDPVTSAGDTAPRKTGQKWGADDLPCERGSAHTLLLRLYSVRPTSPTEGVWQYLAKILIYHLF